MLNVLHWQIMSNFDCVSLFMNQFAIFSRRVILIKLQCKKRNFSFKLIVHGFFMREPTISSNDIMVNDSLTVTVTQEDWILYCVLENKFLWTMQLLRYLNITVAHSYFVSTTVDKYFAEIILLESIPLYITFFYYILKDHGRRLKLPPP